MQKKIIIKEKMGKLMYLSFLSLLCIALCIYALYSPLSRLSEIKIIICKIFALIGFPFALLGFILFVYKAFKSNKNWMEINEEGFIYMNKYFVWWGQVKQISIFQLELTPISRLNSNSNKTIIVKVKNIKKVPIDLSKYNNSRLKLLTKKLNYTTLQLDLTSTKEKYDNILQIMKQYKAEYDRINQAENE